MNKKIIISFSIFIIAILVITVAFTFNNNAPKLDSIKIASLQGPTSIGMIKMIDEKQNISNIDTTYDIIKNPDDLVAKLQTSEYDIACLPVNLAANLYNKGINYELLGVNNLNNIYIIGDDSSIVNITDLKGKTINMINKGATPDVLFSYIMNKNNIDINKDITLDYSMPQTELAAALIAGKVKYAVLPEPFVSQVISKNPKIKILFNFQDELNKVTGETTNIAQGCIVVNKDFAAKNKKIVDEFINQYKQSIDFVSNNIQTAGAMCEKYSLGVTAATAQTAIPRSNIVFISAVDAKSDVNKFLKILYDFAPNSIGNKLPDDGFYYSK